MSADPNDIPPHVRSGGWVTAVIVLGGLLSILYLIVGEWV